MSDVFQALSDPTRREILRLLRKRDMTAGEIAGRFPLAKSTLSGHFSALKHAGLIVAEKTGTSIVYSLNLSAVEQALAAVMNLLEVGGNHQRGEGEIMTITWRSEAVQLTLIAAMFAAALAAWPYAPEQMPVHWNVQGEVDRYGGKFEGLWLTPLVTAGLYVLLLVLPRLDPGRANYRSFAGAYNLIRVALVVFMAALYGVILAAAFGQRVDVGLLVPLGVGALLLLVGNNLGKIRPNWFVGVRTPWTLSSKLSWDKTHRAAGWVFIGLGPLIALVGLVRTAWFLAIVLVAGGAALVGLVIYSYLVYRADPNRVSPAGTSPSPE